MAELAIGIDLGTTNTCVAVVRKTESSPKVETIVNSMGSRITPSIVAFDGSRRYIGTVAKRQMIHNSENTIYEAKRLIGRKKCDHELQKKYEHWPFKIVKDAITDNPLYEVNYMNVQKKFTPEEISSMVLAEVKKDAERSLDCKITKAVITVPAYFSDAQRQATIDAGDIAGLEVLEIINEPTAAAIAFGFGKDTSEEQNVLVYDLGGGTLDVVIITIHKRNFEVKAVCGDKNLGGGDFDDKMVEHVIDIIKKRHNVDLLQFPTSKSKLRNSCEIAKIYLSQKWDENIYFDGLHDTLKNEHFLKLTRAKLEDVCSELVDKAMDPVQKALNLAQMTAADIDKVVLVGGSTRIPIIQIRLSEIFTGKILNHTINPDEAVAHGAAIRAALLSGDTGIEKVELLDVTPFSLGVFVDNIADHFSVIIPRNTRIPAKEVDIYTTASDFQKLIEIRVLEGEPYSKREEVGEFVLENIEVALKDVPQFSITFNIDRNGILSVTAVDKKTKSLKSVEVKAIKGRLSKYQIEERVKKEKNYQMQDKQHSAKLKDRNKLVKYVSERKKAVTVMRKRDEITSDVSSSIIEACNKVEKWLEENPEATSTETKKKYEQITMLCNTLLLPMMMERL